MTMRIKESVKYQGYDMTRSTVVYYLVILSIMLVSTLLTFLIDGSFDGGSFSTGGATVVFLFVLGLNMFKNPFKLLLQNGISRRTQVLGFGLVAVALALVTACIDSLFPLLMTRVHYVSSFASLYESGAAWSWTEFLWTLTGYLAAMTAGYFLTTLYFRMNRLLKVCVSIGVPVLLFVVLPLLEVFVPGFRLGTALLKALFWCLGIDMRTGTFHPMRTVGTFAVFSAVMLVLSYLLAMRATIKD